MSICYWKDHSIVKETYVGQVLELGEHNYYDDSDFYALVFVPETEEFREVCYDTTRFAASNMSANVDATAETIAAYRKFRQRKLDEAKLSAALYDHAKRIELKRAMGITFKQMGRILSVLSPRSAMFDVIVALLSVKNFRSEFRKGMAEQVRAWLDDPSPKYCHPLSERQYQCLVSKYTKEAWPPFKADSTYYPNI